MCDFKNMARDSLGLISLDSLELKDIRSFRDYYHSTFIYKGKRYFYKEISCIDNCYNELISYELAKDYGIDCVEYEFVCHMGQIGLICEEIPNLHLLSEYIPDENCNLEDIWTFLDNKYEDKELVYKLMDELVNIFIFDILIGNNDRHTDNLGLVIKDGSINFSPIFDNDNLLNELSLYYDEHALGIDKNYSSTSRFIDISDSYYKDLIKEKLRIISPENIDNCLKRVEARIKAPLDKYIIVRIKDRFKTNYEILNRKINQKIMTK